MDSSDLSEKTRLGGLCCASEISVRSLRSASKGSLPVCREERFLPDLSVPGSCPAFAGVCVVFLAAFIVSTGWNSPDSA